jgi:hypothetical protein
LLKPLFPTLLENGEKPMKTEKEKWLCVKISADTMKRLLMANQLCAADMNCLDCKSKDCLRRLCLECCTAKGNLGTGRPHTGKVIPWPGKALKDMPGALF